MLAVDTNVLVYAHRQEPAEHEPALELLRGLAEGGESWAIPWPCIFEFWSVVTNPRIWKTAASTPHQARKQLEAWFGAPELRLLAEPEGFPGILMDFLARPRVRGGVAHDARIAALCVAHGVERLLTRDRDFSLFPELQTANPFD